MRFAAAGGWAHENRVRVKADFVSGFKLIRVVQIRIKKYFASVFQKYVIASFCPAPERGALRDRHERWKRDAMDAKVS